MFVRALIAAAATLVCCSAHAWPASVTVPGYNPSAGTLVSSDFGRLLQGAAKLEGAVNTAGKAIGVSTVSRVGPTAARVIAGACFANPPLCAGVAMAGWLLLSDLVVTPDGIEKGEEKEGSVACIGDTCTPSASVTCDVFAAKMGQSMGVAMTGKYVDGGAPPTYEGVIGTCTPTRSNGSTEGLYMVERKKGRVLEYRPATEHDIDIHIEDHPTVPDDALNESPVPVPVLPPEVEEKFEPLGEPYPGPDPQVGPWKRDGITIRGKPETTTPDDVEVTPSTRDTDNPNTPENEGDTGTGGGVDRPAEDPCKFHPDSAGCVSLGTLSAEKLPHVTVPTAITKTGGWVENQACPAPRVVPTHVAGNIEFKFDQFCMAADYARPVVLAVAYMIAIGGFLGLATKRD